MADSKSARGSFPAKLYELVEGHARTQSEDDLVVAWCEGGLAFIVRDLTRFCEEVLPQHFCHNKWASFIRQLNLYGFRRITQGQSSGAYWHKYFQRGQPQLLRGITRARRTTAGGNGAFQDGDDEDDHAFAQQRQLAGGPPATGSSGLLGNPPGVGVGGVGGPHTGGGAAAAGFSSRFGSVDRGRGPLSQNGWGGHHVGPNASAPPPMHTAVPLPQMPVLQSLASLPPPPIISDEALLRELDHLVQQQKAHHEKLAAPSPASSSNSLSRIRTDLSGSNLANVAAAVNNNNAAGAAPRAPANAGAPQNSVNNVNNNNVNNNNVNNQTPVPTASNDGPPPSVENDRTEARPAARIVPRDRHQAGLIYGTTVPPPKIEISARYLEKQSADLPPDEPPTVRNGRVRDPHGGGGGLDDDDRSDAEASTPNHPPRSFAFPASQQRQRDTSGGGGDYAIGEDLAAAASAVSLNGHAHHTPAPTPSTTTANTVAFAPVEHHHQTHHHQTNGHTPPPAYRRPPGIPGGPSSSSSMVKKNYSFGSFAPAFSAVSTAASYNANGNNNNNVANGVNLHGQQQPLPPHAVTTSAATTHYEPTTSSNSNDLLSMRKRIASHQSVHSVGSLDAGSMTEVGGHPLAKREHNMRTMSKSSLASDDWDLDYAGVDGVTDLNFEEWRWNESSGGLQRQDSRDFLRSAANLNNATNAPTFPRGASSTSLTGRPFGSPLHGDLFSIGNGSPAATTTKHNVTIF